MMVCSTKQALEIWTELERAFRGESRYGGDVSEIYAFRLLPHSPSAGQRLEICAEDDRRRAEDASAAMTTILELFIELHDGVTIEVDGRPFKPGKTKLQPEPHRWHIQVVAPKED